MPTVAPPDRYIQVGPIRTRYWAAGDAGTTVLLVHGLACHVEDWAENIHALAGRHRVYALDMVGCGRSDKPRGSYTLSRLVRFVGDFMRALNIERASLVGHSLGGAVALLFAQSFPQQVEKLVLVNSAGLGREVDLLLRASSLPVAGRWLTRPRREGVARYLLKATYDPAIVTSELVEASYQLAALPGAQRALLATLRAVIDLGGIRRAVYRPILDNLAHIAAPCLVIWGRQDRILPAAHAAVAGAKIPGAGVHVFDRCGHFTQWERPEEFNTLMQEFLAG
jgi:pimeloyl-ACP methyl ester carboxylesterase